MGWLSSAGSVSRIVGPVFASYCMQYAGPFAVFASITGLLTLTLVSLLVFWRQLAPVIGDGEELDDDDIDEVSDDDDEIDDDLADDASRRV